MAPTQQETTTSCVDKHDSGTTSCINTNNSLSSKKNKESSSNSISISSSSSSSSSSSNSSSSNSNNSTSNNNSTNSCNRTTTNNLGESLLGSITDLNTFLPVTSRGLFYHDSFFEEARQQFDFAVKEVLNNWGQRSVLEDDLTTYRKLREINLTEDSQAVTVSEQDTYHQVVMDVRDFQQGEVKVKVVDENELVVEGSVEQKEGNSTSTKSFCRCFTFPGLVRSEVVTSTMSSDGVLTITVPKKLQKKQKQQVNVETVKTTGTHVTNENKTKGSQSSNDNSVKEKTSSINSSKVAEKEETQTEKKVQFKKVNEINTSSEESSQNLLKSNKRESTTNLTHGSSDLLPITSKGRFFEDSFFAQVHQDFKEAVKGVLEYWGEAEDDDAMGRYRSLRKRDLKEETQAVSLTEDHENHKVVMDVRDFQQGEVKVKVVDENELVVEGSVEQKEGNSTSTKSFCRCFTFPGLVRSEVVTSTMSSDGVLTITIPNQEPSKLQNTNLNCISDSKNSSSTLQHNSTSAKTCLTKMMNHNSSTTKAKSLDVADTQTSRCKSSNKDVSRDHSTHTTQDVRAASMLEEDRLSSTATVGSKPSLSWDSLLPVDLKGLFFHDSFFQDTRQDFETAVKNVLTRFGRSEQLGDDLSVYRDLRQHDLRDENQAMKLTENERSHQVVLDVQDFMKGDIKVKMVGENEIQVEGVMEEHDDGKKSSKRFSRRWQLPGVIDVEAVTSALSSDGVLTITAPKVVRT